VAAKAFGREAPLGGIPGLEPSAGTGGAKGGWRSRIKGNGKGVWDKEDTYNRREEFELIEAGSSSCPFCVKTCELY